MIGEQRARVDRAWQWLQRELAGAPVPAFLVFIGLRDGAVLDALERYAPGTRVVALEPDGQQARAFLQSETWATWRTSGRLAYMYDPDYAGADEAWRMFPSGVTVPTVVIHPEMTLTEGVARASQRLKQILFGIEANAAARRRFAPGYLANSIRNLPSIAHGADVRQLTDAYSGTPAIVLAAGPSLDAALPLLREESGRGLLIAADTALRPLLAAGIAPHLVVGLDPGPMNARHFLSLPECRHTWLVTESALDPVAAAHFGDRTFWFRVSNHHPWPWFNELGVDVGRVDVWGSVLTAAFQVACLAGCDPIVIVGADLAFTDGRPYARGTTYEFDWAWGTAGETSLTDSWRAATAKASAAPDLRGGTTQTTRSMISVRDWMLARASRSGRRVVNASGAGTLFGEGIELGALRGVVPAGTSVRPIATVANRRRTVVPMDLTGAVRNVQVALASDQATPLLVQWRDFSGGTLDTKAVGAALEEAAVRLAGRARAHSGPVIRWQRPTSGVLCPLLTHLPEAVAGRRLGLLAPSAGVRSTVDGADASTPALPAQCLLAAWDLIEGIAHAVLRADEDLPRALDATQVGHARACNLYAWPETVRWAVLLFEGLLAESDAAVFPRTNTYVTGAGLPQLAAHVNPLAEGTRPNAHEACALLILDWLRSAGASPELYRPIAEQLHEDAVARATGHPPMPAALTSTARVRRA